MNNEINNRYKVGDDEVFEFKPTSHNSDELLSVFDEVYYNQTKEQIYRNNTSNNTDEIFYRQRRQDIATKQIDRISNKSTGNTRTSYNNKRRHSNIIIAKKRKEVAKILCAIALVGVLLPTTVTAVDNMSDNIKMHANVERGTSILTEEAFERLFNNNLATKDKRGKYTILENTITDYRKLEATSHLDVYVFKQILPEAEFNKFIKSVSYNNGYNYYVDFYQFLNINGYYLSGSNTPSGRVFDNMMEEVINNLSDKLVLEYNLEEKNSETSTHGRGGI